MPDERSMPGEAVSQTSKLRATEWNIGQPLEFPPVKNRDINRGINRIAREVVEEAMRGPFKRKRQKRKKK
jgi:hypothetical protein